MTNFEYYKEEILNIINDGDSFAVCKNSNKPVRCDSITCEECISSDEQGCDKGVYNWLYSEYTEQPKQPKLTKKERQFCELVEKGWIAIDADERLYYFKEEPAKDIKRKTWEAVPFSKVIEIDQFDDCYFYFITWEDTEPWSIEDLLKLEVEE